MTSHKTVLIRMLVLAGLQVGHDSISTGFADDVDDQLKIIGSVGTNGTGSQAAGKASDRLLKQGPQILPRLLASMDTPNIVAANWYRSVFEQIVARELKSKTPRLPLALFRRHVEDPRRQGRVRRRLLTIVESHDPGYRSKLLPRMFDDPEFRDDAVEHALARGDSALKHGDKTAARGAFHSAFRHARNDRQIVRAADRLKSLGDTVSIIEHMGFVTDWYLLGPFDAPGKTGFTRNFPPETKVDLKATYTGKDARKLAWKRHHTTDRLGQINLIRAVASVKEAVGYGYTELHSPRKQAVELRCGADDNLTVWLNGEKVFSRLQWLNGTRLDRFTTTVNLKAGKNRLLVKVCQGPQHRNPAVPNNWSMQLRFCFKDGRGAGLTSLLPPPSKENAPTP